MEPLNCFGQDYSNASIQAVWNSKKVNPPPVGSGEEEVVQPTFTDFLAAANSRNAMVCLKSDVELYLLISMAPLVEEVTLLLEGLSRGV